MYLEELIIEGFKSYANKTVISSWDREFNAITGLNGSGKSNILDAICFVLGIENLKQVRAASLQDLVYKKGQAGISKASVTIVFNNSERAKSPVGYSDCPQISVTRQIIVGGKNKYMINGHNVPQKSIENLFQSVGLNINNPHFLIMQGQITKVLNMKPIEILALIEEAAGTRMFEDRKEKALGTFEKKEGKVKEITQLLNDIIMPKLEKLREERSSFMEFQKLEAEIDRLKRASVALEYLSNQMVFHKSSSKVEQAENLLGELEETQTSQKAELDEKKAQMDALAKKEASSKKSREVEKLEERFKEVSNELVRMKTQIELELEQHAEDKKQLSKLKNGGDSSLKKRDEASFQMVKSAFEKKKTDFEAKKVKVERLESLIQSLLTGVSGKEGAEGGYRQLLRETSEDLISTKSKLEQSTLKIEKMLAELKEKIPRAEKSKKDYARLTADLDKLGSEIGSLQSALDLANDGNGDLDDLNSEKTRLQRSQQNLRQQLSSLQSNFGNLSFSYQDPTPNFDRRKVKGLVANLITIPSEKRNCSTAVEVCAGGRLYNVVVENEVVASQLLERGKLSKRVTIIPLNKINPHVVPKETVAAAKKLAPGKVELALDIIGHEDDVRAAMQYVFGSAFICADKETANIVAFDKSIRTKCVTLDGDVYDPSGTLTGGSSGAHQSILAKLSEIKSLTEQIQEIEGQLVSIESQIKVVGDKKARTDEIRNLLDVKSHQLSLQTKQFNENPIVKLHLAVDALQSGVSNEKKLVVELTQKLATLERDVKQYEQDAQDFGEDRSGKLEELQAELKSEKALMKKLTADFLKIEKEYNICATSLSTEAEAAEQRLGAIEELERSIRAFKKQEIPRTLRAEHEQLEQELGRLREEAATKNRAFNELEKQKKTLEEAISETLLQMQQLNLELKTVRKEAQEAKHIVDSLESKHPFLSTMTDEEKRLFQETKGVSSEARNQLRALESRHEKLARNINVQVMDLIDRVEKKESSLTSMLSTVKRDRQKIENTIGKLNDYKRDTLMKTWKKVNEDFGQIFGELLPGAFAKLEENGTIMDGILVKVCLGGIWKQSLAELSGGQRSLVALALILALLQYNPAPMYILDEVDAALDLSHTQNIGNLLKSRFKGSQFIVVSLKDGMFSNANCLFKTRFKDGVSSVERIAAAAAPTKKKAERPGQPLKATTMIAA